MDRSPSRRAGGWSVALALVGATAFCGGREPPVHHRLDIEDLAYLPAVLEVSVGDTVTWLNHDIVPHTVSAAEGGIESEGRIESGEISTTGSFDLVLTRADTIRYTCRYHPLMTGVLVVR